MPSRSSETSKTVSQVNGSFQYDVINFFKNVVNRQMLMMFLALALSPTIIIPILEFTQVG